MSLIVTCALKNFFSTKTHCNIHGVTPPLYASLVWNLLAYVHDQELSSGRIICRTQTATSITDENKRVNSAPKNSWTE